MEIHFRTNRLKRNYEESARAVRQWGRDVAQKYITRINQLYALEDVNDAYRLRSMRLHPLKGTVSGKMSIHLTERWRLIVTRGESEEIVIIEEVSNHYDD